MALDLSLSNRVRASVSSEADSGYSESLTEINSYISNTGSVRSADVSPVPKLFRRLNVSSTHSAPVSPCSNLTSTIRTSNIQKQVEETYSNLSSTPKDHPVEHHMNNSQTTSERKFLKEMKSKTLLGQPPKLISDCSKDSRRNGFNMDSLLATSKGETNNFLGKDRTKKRSDLIPPPLQLYPNSLQSTPQLNLSPYDIFHKRHIHMQPSTFNSPNSPQRFNFDLMNLGTDLPIHSPVNTVSPFGAQDSSRIFNFISLPNSPHINRPSHMASSPLLTMSPLLAPSHGWPVLQSTRLDSKQDELSGSLPFQPYISSPSSTVKRTFCEHPISTRSPGGKIRECSLRSPKPIHPYDTKTREISDSRADKVAAIRRRIFSNVDLKGSASERSGNQLKQNVTDLPLYKTAASKPNVSLTLHQTNPQVITERLTETDRDHIKLNGFHDSDEENQPPNNLSTK